MIDRIRDLDGAAELLTWISLANMAVALALMVAVPIRRAAPPLAWTMALVAAIVAVYARSAYRAVTGSPITYAGAMIHAGIAVAGIGMLVAVLRSTPR